MSDTDSDDEMLAPPRAAATAPEFELDDASVRHMRANEARIIGQQLQQPPLTQAQISAATKTIVNVKLEPVTDTADSGAVVRVKLEVFDRFIPHLADSLDRSTAPQSQPQSVPRNDSAMAVDETRAPCVSVHQLDSNDSGDESDSESADEDTTGRDLTLTGDRVIDAATLKKLIGVASDSDTDDSDIEPDQLTRMTGTHTNTDSAMMDEDDDDTGTATGEPLRTKNEMHQSSLPPPQPFTVSADEPMVACGNYVALVDGLMIVECDPTSKALDINSAIALIDRTPVGRIEEVFGPISQPFYNVRPLESFVREGLPQLVNGTKLFNVPSLSSYVLVDTAPGSDASNIHDEEVAADDAEFSDDEKEQLAKADKKAKKKKHQRHNDAAVGSASHASGSRSQYPSQQRMPTQPRSQQYQPAQPQYFAHSQQYANGYHMPQPNDSAGPAAYHWHHGYSINPQQFLPAAFGGQQPHQPPSQPQQSLPRPPPPPLLTQPSAPQPFALGSLPPPPGIKAHPAAASHATSQPAAQ